MNNKCLGMRQAVKIGPLAENGYWRVVLAIFAVVSILFSISARGQVEPQDFAGSLDAGFGTGGKVVTDFLGVGIAADLVLQPDGKIIAAGLGFDPANQSTDFAVARYNPDGSLDASFGSGGKVTTDFFQRDDRLVAIALQPDGKIVAAGRVFSPTGDLFAVARYDGNGALDPGFGTAGKATLSFGGGRSGPTAVTMQPNGKIIVAGFTTSTDVEGQVALARFNSDGSLDASFGDSGQKIGPDVGAGDWATGIALQPGGKIVITGGTFSALSAQDFLLVRYNANGSVDPSFGTGGWVTTDFSGFGDFAGDRLLALPDGKLVVSGTAQFLPGGTGHRFVMAHYSSDGVLDPSWGNGGKVDTSFGQNPQCLTASLQADGRIVLGGYTRDAGNLPDFALVRFNTDGSLDSNFGTNGRVTTEFFGRADVVNAVAVQPDGRIIGAGYAQDPQGNLEFAVARYMGSAEFALAVSEPSVSAARGAKVKIPILINRATGFTGTVTITPPDATTAFKPKPAAPTTTTDNRVVLKLKIKAGAPPGPHRATFVGRSDDGGMSAVVVTVNVQ